MPSPTWYWKPEWEQYLDQTNLEPRDTCKFCENKATYPYVGVCLSCLEVINKFRQLTGTTFESSKDFIEVMFPGFTLAPLHTPRKPHLWESYL